jgi:hypothetical protein
MRLEPLYRIRFTYPESWAVGLDGGWQRIDPSQHGDLVPQHEQFGVL